jgi:DNA-binding transcriptional ArsR family regulator
MPTKRPFTDEMLALVAERFRVLGDTQRLRILNALLDGERCVTDLAEQLGTTQPNASKHLKILQGAGLVARRPDKTAAYYSISDETVFELCHVVCRRLEDRFTAQLGVIAPSRRHAR